MCLQKNSIPIAAVWTIRVETTTRTNQTASYRLHCARDQQIFPTVLDTYVCTRVKKLTNCYNKTILPRLSWRDRLVQHQQVTWAKYSSSFHPDFRQQQLVLLLYQVQTSLDCKHNGHSESRIHCKHTVQLNSINTAVKYYTLKHVQRSAWAMHFVFTHKRHNSSVLQHSIWDRSFQRIMRVWPNSNYSLFRLANVDSRRMESIKQSNFPAGSEQHYQAQYNC